MKHFFKSIVTFTAIFNSVSILATPVTMNLSHEDILNEIDLKIEKITKADHLANQLDLRKLDREIEKNLENKEELIKINKELVLFILDGRGTVCAC